MKLRLLALCLLTLAASTIINARTIRVFAIGNSFSVDAVEQNLYDLALAQGDTLIIGNAYIGGCSVDRHYNNALGDKPEYSYRKISADGIKTLRENARLSEMIVDEPWEVITLQQASHDSGIKSTYANLPRLKAYVDSMMPVKEAKLLWHKTWSYSADATHSAFPRYGCNQTVMNDSINAAIASEVIPLHFDGIIPAGDAITAGRTVFGDILNADGYHLSHNLGRYVAACTWCEILTGKSVVGNPFHPADLTDAQALEAQKAAHKAVNAEL